MAVLGGGNWKQSAGILDTSQSCHHWQIDPSPALDQSIHRLEFVVQGRRVYGAVGIGSVLAEEIDEWNLHATVTGHAASRDQHQRFVQGGGFHASAENHFDDIENGIRQIAAANRILSREFQQGWIQKVVSTLEDDALPHQIRMLVQVGAQACHVARIEQVHGAPKCRVFNSLMVGQIQMIGERWLFDVPLQPRPAGKSGLARDGELRVTEAQMGVEDLGIGGSGETRMEFPEALGHFRIARGMRLAQVFGLILKMIEVGI